MEKIKSNAGRSSAAITTAEWELIEFFVQLGSLLGFPSSVSKVYGLIFSKEAAISADDCVGLLGISRSSAGQALKQLLDFGAIRRSVSRGLRYEVYQVEPDLGVIVRSYLGSRFFPSIDELGLRVKRLQANPAIQKHRFLMQRVEKLLRWGKKMKPLVSSVGTLFGQPSLLSKR